MVIVVVHTLNIKWFCEYCLVVMLVIIQCDSTDSCTVCFTVAGSDRVEVKDQQMQTEIIQTEHKNVQVGSTTKQQGVYCVCPLKWDVSGWIAILVIF